MNKIELDDPTLIFVGGIAGVGKTTFAKEFIKYIYGAFLIDKDIINEAFLSTRNESDTGILFYRFSGPKIQRNDDYYHKNVKFQSYHSMLELAKDNLEIGKHPVLEGNYTKEIRKGYLDEVVFPFFEEINHKTKLVFCYADEETVKERLKERGLFRDDDKFESEEIWKNFLKEQPILPPELEKYDHVKINTTKPLEENIKKTLDYLIE